MYFYLLAYQLKKFLKKMENPTPEMAKKNFTFDQGRPPSNVQLVSNL